MTKAEVGKAPSCSKRNFSISGITLPTYAIIASIGWSLTKVRSIPSSFLQSLGTSGYVLTT